MSLPTSAASRVCGVNVEYKNFNAGAGGFLPQRLAVVGLGNADAVYGTDKYESAGSADAIAKRYGYGSPLHLAARQLFPAGGGGAEFPVTFYPLATPAGAAQAQGEISCTGTAEENGSGELFIGGVKAVFAIRKEESADEIIASVKAAIDGTLEMPVAAGEAAGGVLPLTAKWAGAGGSEIVLRVQTETAGVTLGVTAMAGGAVDPDITPALEAVGQVWETFILDCFPYQDATRLDTYQTFCEGRWSELEKKPCLVAHGSSDDYAIRAALTDARKTDYANFLIQSTGSPELPFVIAAKGLAGIMNTANSNPPMGYKTLLTGLEAGADAAQENYQTRNNAFAKGASTSIKNGSAAELNDVITFYHPDGEAIPSRRYVVDLVKLQNIVFNMRLILESDEYKAAPLVSDATPTTNPKAVQPKTIRTALVNLANALSAYAIIQEPEFTKSGLKVEISSQNPKRLDVQFPCKLSGNVEVVSADIYFGFYLGAA